MKKRTSLIALILVVALTMTGCAYWPGIFTKRARTDGVNETKTFNELSEFTGITIEGLMEDVVLDIQEGEYAVTVETDRAYFNELDISVRGESLRIAADDRLRMKKLIHITITAPNINTLDFRGGMRAVSSGTMAGKNLSINLDGATEAELNLDYDEVKIEVSGAGELKLSGRADDFQLRCSGAASVKAEDLSTKEANIHISGAGEASIRCSDRLHASISGAGEIKYIGNPEVTKDVSGAGSIHKLDD